MRNSYLTAGFLSMALLLAMSVPGAAQSSTTNSPEQKSPEASSPSAPPQSTPSQAAPSQAGAASEAAPGPAQSKAQTEDNPLNLTDEQKAKLRPILVEENQQLDTLRNDTSMTQEQKVSKANEIRQTASPKIRAILTPEQLQKLLTCNRRQSNSRIRISPQRQPHHRTRRGIRRAARAALIQFRHSKGSVPALAKSIV